MSVDDEELPVAGAPELLKKSTGDDEAAGETKGANDGDDVDIAELDDDADVDEGAIDDAARGGGGKKKASPPPVVAAFLGFATVAFVPTLMVIGPLRE